jgi:hypothetical protein
MTMFRKSWTWRCQTNYVGALETCARTDLARDTSTSVHGSLSLHNMYALSLDLRLLYVLKM